MKYYSKRRQHRHELYNKSRKQCHRVFIDKKLVVKVIVDCRTTYPMDTSLLIRHRFHVEMSFRRQIDLIFVLAISIIFKHFLLWEPILSYCGIMLSCCNFNNIDVITDFGTIGTISFGNIATMQINRNNDKFYFLQNNTNRDYNSNITKNNTYLLQNNNNQSF